MNTASFKATLIILTLILTVGCGGKSEVKPAPAAPEETTAPADPPPAESPAADPAPEEAPADEPVERVALEFELPEKFFGGTPLPYWSPQLEEENFAPREPFLAPVGTEILSRDATVTSSTTDPSIGDLGQIVDGDKDYAKSSLVELDAGVQWVQIDLGEPANLYAILLWHFHEGPRVYFDVIVRASNDPSFENDVTTLYNNDHDNSAGLGAGEDMEYIESERGRLVDAEGINARYIRLYSNGNTTNELNNYVEVEVWGKQ
jgi:hypothetical protein